VYWGCVAEVLQKEPQVFPREWEFPENSGAVPSRRAIFCCYLQYQRCQPSVSLQAEAEPRVAGGPRAGSADSSVSRVGWMKNLGLCAFCVPWEVQQLSSDSEVLSQQLGFMHMCLGA